ncbi:MAG: energy transducer TonB [Burkholderiales bacterium]|uniref:energy transducer TonB n=1 Tax=Inhella sp. TaxID=1921806 RepID=UPI001AD362A2|nr:energy transducer TonB [Burkholderiales bacterium]
MRTSRILTLSLLLATATALQANPKVVKKVPPEFPTEAVRKNINAGSVKAKLTIGADGKVLEVEILESEPKRVFDRVSIEALKEWRFEPAADKQTHEVKLVFRNDE